MSISASYRTLSTAQKRAALVVLLFIGLFVRLALILPGFPASRDAQIYSEWGQAIETNGLENAYEGTSVDYPPFLLYIIGAAAQVGSTNGQLDQDLAPYRTSVNLTLELISALSDILTACLLAAALWRQSPGIASLAVFLYLFNPVPLYLTAVWGQTDSIYTLFMVAAVFAIERRALIPAWVIFALALTTKLQSISLLPLMFIWTYTKYGVRSLVSGIALGFTIITLVFSPWLFSGHALSLLRPYTTPGEGRVVVSAYNAWYIAVGGNLRIPATSYPIGLPFSYHDIGLAVFVALAAIVTVLAARFELSMALPASVMALSLFLVLTDIHERHSYPVIPFLLWAASQMWKVGASGTSAKTSRIYSYGLWWAYAVITLTSFFNIISIFPFTTMFGTSILATDPGSLHGKILKSLSFATALINILLFVWLLSKMRPKSKPSLTTRLPLHGPDQFASQPNSRPTAAPEAQSEQSCSRESAYQRDTIPS
jgi:Gpi18-like mannosyltransferase